MEREEYKSICERHDSFHRGIIESTERSLNLISPSLASRLQYILKGSPISKPSKHEGGSQTDYFIVDLKKQEVVQIVEHLIDQEASEIGENGEIKAKSGHYASLADQWTNYLQTLC